MLVDKADVIYVAIPLILLLFLLSWHGAHDVSKIFIGVLVFMIPALFYIVYAERFDSYWIQREESKPAEVFSFLFASAKFVIIKFIVLYAT